MGIGIPIAFLILIVSLAWLLIHVKGRIFTKILFAGIVPYYCLVMWCSLNTFAGWATDELTPDKLIVRWIIIEEPNKKTGDEGGIYIWIQSSEQNKFNGLNFLGYNSEPYEPRAYKLPYSRRLHEQAEAALKLLKKGRRVTAARPLPGDGDGEDGEDTSGYGYDDNDNALKFYELPQPKYPEKYE
jgi:hypothetical protein